MPEILVEGAYAERFRGLYRTEEGGVVAERDANVDAWTRARASAPETPDALNWCVPYAYDRMDPFDCHQVRRVVREAGAVFLPASLPFRFPPVFSFSSSP